VQRLEALGLFGVSMPFVNWACTPTIDSTSAPCQTHMHDNNKCVGCACHPCTSSANKVVYRHTFKLTQATAARRNPGDHVCFKSWPAADSETSGLQYDLGQQCSVVRCVSMWPWFQPQRSLTAGTEHQSACASTEHQS